MKNLIMQKPLKQMFLIFFLFLVGNSSALLGQTITSVTPDSAVQGTTDLLVTIIISGDQLPPSQAPVDQVTIGTIAGTSLVHVSETEITAIFNIPFDTGIGSKDVAVTFQPPQGGPIIFSLEDGFTIT